MSLDLGSLFKEKKENELKGKTVKMVEEIIKQMKEDQLTYSECMLITEVLRNSLLRQGNEFLNSKYLNHIIEEK